MVQAAVRAAGTVPAQFVFDGQSHNKQPVSFPFPYHLTRQRGIPWAVPAIGGQSMTALLADAATRLWPLCDLGTESICIVSGGTSDILFNGDTGAQVYDDHVDWSEGVRAHGSTITIACTMTGTTSFDAGMETARQNFNTLLVADAEDAFDVIADVDAALVAEYGATYWANAALFPDGLHMNNATAEFYAGAIADVLDPLL